MIQVPISSTTIPHNLRNGVLDSQYVVCGATTQKSNDDVSEEDEERGRLRRLSLKQFRIGSGPKELCIPSLCSKLRHQDADNKAVVSEMIKHRRRRSAIYEFLLEKSEHIIQKDFDNFVQAHRYANKQDGHDESALMLAKIAAIDGISVSVYETSVGETGVMSITSCHMRSMFAVSHNFC
ncbi:hypothetical protein GQ600_20423 [Phytophthora cactorum]|nr:hypothetical protein GQ600_24352 [Phytophthora cactorum]KAF1772601.1 hypothetical protein GQ600_20423 [Phytophthora cactorum]